MSLSYLVSAPCKVQVSADSASPSYSDIGFMENNNLLRIGIIRNSRVHRATDTGDEPGAITHTGSMLSVSLVMSKPDVKQSGGVDSWLSDVFDTLFSPPGSSSMENAGVIGTELYTGQAFVRLKFLPTTSGKTPITIPRFWMDGDNTGEIRDYGGNEHAKIALNGIGLRFDTSGSLPDGSSATSNLWIEETAV